MAKISGFPPVRNSGENPEQTRCRYSYSHNINIIMKLREVVTEMPLESNALRRRRRREAGKQMLCYPGY